MLGNYLPQLFIRVMDIYVAPGFALLLTKKEPPATLAAANAIIGSVHAHVCALGCALSAVFSYLDVNVGGSGEAPTFLLAPSLYCLFTSSMQALRLIRALNPSSRTYIFQGFYFSCVAFSVSGSVCSASLCFCPEPLVLALRSLLLRTTLAVFLGVLCKCATIF